MVFLRALVVFSLCVAAGSARVSAQVKGNSTNENTAARPASAPQTLKGEGISVEFSAQPVTPRTSKTSELLAGEDVVLRFKIVETSGGKALSSLRPAAWIDQRSSAQTTALKECREKIQAFLQPNFNKRPLIDFNAYFVLALNHEPNISVIDPLSGFGGSKLYNLVGLRSSGEDWAMSPDRKRLYVSMPEVGEVAVVDTLTWTIIANVAAGVNPMRLTLQHDGRYLWVGNDGANEKDSGVTVIDTVALEVAAQIKTGLGHHEIVLTDDDSSSFITNRQDGTLSVIDVRKLAKVTDVKVGSQPVGVVFSSLGKAVYVANEADGTIVAVDPLKFEVLARMKAEPGLRDIGIPADSRFGFAVNTVKSKVYVFDLSSNRLIHAVPVGPGSDQITFTKQFAYVRSAGSEFVTMIKMADLAKEASVSRFPAGQKAPQESPASSLASAIIAAPEEGAVLVANPADKMIYYYTEGMAAPMGSFQNYRRDPKALLVLDNSLREDERGVYSTTIRLNAAGHYDVAFLLDSPRLVNCFNFEIAENPALPKADELALKIDPLWKDNVIPVGQPYTVRFKVRDYHSDEAKPNLPDMGVLVFLAPGIWQQREVAKAVGDGVYEMTFVPPQAGVYYVYFQCPSLGLRYNQTFPLTLQAVKTADASTTQH